ncbi:ABC transporter permease [Flavilitoribacter nigricans]|uniref:ABC transporter permease n=1 Tax=Flavilitoribacter nigricans (strain ATCC 23147 / DSM 23189 / NBRC 102662 / NCIMB 1420 / SS-2) TaxID=1122177 RepID=A0A2D0NHB8_FLAN2|nr:ABC transporter permease [Flavilitoribacter nigricans]PHN07163.1 ABC transporter permease [Flavilitoribacter nigricans DSM 23189 = NBRC 102662]
MIFGKKHTDQLAEELEQTSGDQRYWALVKQRFRKNRPAVWALRTLYVLGFIAIFGDFIANERPIYCKVEGTTYFPVFREFLVDLDLAKPYPRFLTRSWLDVKKEYEAVLLPLIPYSFDTQDPDNRNYKGPLEEQEVSSWRYRHWLGTDNLGRDVAAGLVNGTRTAMLVGIIAMGIAALIGISLGAIAGYFGDDRLRWSRARVMLNVLGVVLGIFYGFTVRTYALQESEHLFVDLLISLGIFGAILVLFNGLAWLLERWSVAGKKLRVPVDLLVMRAIEIKRSIPTLLLLLAILALISRPNIFYVMAIIGLLGWTSIARFMRAEMLRIRALDYMEATRALGYSNRRILFRHAIPNGLTPVLVTIAFGIAGAILTEASLSFIGIGMPPDQVTWGTMLFAARFAPYAWWLAIFPGFFIFITVLSFNLIGEGLTEAIHARR